MKRLLISGALFLITNLNINHHCCLLKSPEMPMHKGLGVSGF